LYADVRDATRTRTDAGDPRASTSDHVDLVLARGAQTRRYLLASGAPGPFEAHPDTTGGGFPERLAGAWQEDGSGYPIQLRIPDGERPERIGIGVYDAAEPGEVHVDMRTLLAYDARAAHALAALVPDRVRARVVDTDGWLIAGAGVLRATAPLAEGSHGWL